MSEVVLVFLAVIAVLLGLGLCLFVGIGVGLLWIRFTRRIQGGNGRRKPRRRYGFRANFAHRWAQWN
jgi:hypothetical protein